MIAMLLWLNPLHAPAAQPRFPVPIDLCALVDASLVKQLVPGAKANHDRYECAWTGQGVGLTAESITEDPEREPWGSTNAQAHELYRKRLANDLAPSLLTIWEWPAIGVPTEKRRSVTTTVARTVAGVGDEAHTVDHRRPRTKELERVYVTFRAGNLLFKVAYTAIDGRVSAKRLRQGALSVSSSMAATLDRMSPPEPAPTSAPGIYAETPIACAMFTPAQLKDLGVEVGGRAGLSAESCTWSWRTFQKRLFLDFHAPQRGPAGDAVAQAKEMFAGWKSPESTSVDIGDEALVIGSGVVFRKSNLIGSLTARTPAQAQQAARWLVEDLS
ncbi:hypothetical protein ACTWPT_44795 [Nonomuraea sp. 3N208]|uniref:hypothetical protein n=1 Tax=Nonomuraea sp. 3N208 TaxID=3457421 RepID=UPI003FCEEFAC